MVVTTNHADVKPQFRHGHGKRGLHGVRWRPMGAGQDTGPKNPEVTAYVAAWIDEQRADGRTWQAIGDGELSYILPPIFDGSSRLW